MINVLGFTPKYDCSASYRLINPSNLFSGSRLHIAYSNSISTSLIAECDALIILRASLHEDIISLAKTAKQLGKKVIFDMDDIMWDLPWGYSLEEEGHFVTEEKRKGILSNLARYLDAITCSTEELRNRARNDLDLANVNVLHNFSHITGKVHPIITPVEKKIVLQGDERHAYYDWLQLKDAQLLEEENPENEDSPNVPTNILLAIFGMPDDMYMSYGFKCKTEWWPQVKLNFFYQTMERISAGVGLAPLHPGLAINQCKSIIKLLEYSKLGMSVVASPVGEYKQCPDAYFAKSSAEWVEQIKIALKKPNAEAVNKWRKGWDKEAHKGWFDFFSKFFGEKLEVKGNQIVSDIETQGGPDGQASK